MLKSELISLYQALNKLGNLKGVKFAYGVSKNISIIKPEIELLEKSATMTDEYKEFEEERIKMVEKFAKKDDKGKPIMVNDVYDIEKDNQKELNKAFEVLKSEHKKAFEAREKQVQEYNELLKTDSTIKLFKISLGDIPNEITVAQMHSISEIVEDSIPTPYK
jgi:formate dehydrogenase maturation protein FdhE